MRPASSPSPFFRPGGRNLASSRVGAVKAGAGATRSVAEGLALTAQACPTAILGFRLAGLGFSASWAPLGAAGALAPPAAHASRAGFAAEGEDGDGAGWAGEQIPQLGRHPQQAEAAAGFGGWSARMATHLTRSAPRQGGRGALPP